MSNGKGSGRRPAAITRDEFDAAWERNFGVKREVVTTYTEIAKATGVRNGRPAEPGEFATVYEVPEHVCGLMGFNGMLGDVCPACSSGAGA